MRSRVRPAGLVDVTHGSRKDHEGILPDDALDQEVHLLELEVGLLLDRACGDDDLPGVVLDGTRV